MNEYLDLYKKIKSIEPTFQVPANYVTIDVGTFDAITGVFTGLITDVEYDPEPIVHRPGDHPNNPKPYYQHEWSVSIIIDHNWRGKTIKRTPAPKVDLAPVLLKFSVKNHQNSTWIVTIDGQTVNVAAGQSTVSINLWDLRIANWTIQCGGKSYSDRIMIQRPDDAIIGVGAFTVPALPLAIVYAPPADAEKLSTTSYTIARMIGTTSSIQLHSETSNAQPWLPQNLADLQTFQTLLNSLSTVLSKVPTPYTQAIAAVCSVIASGIGTMSGSATVGTVSADGITLTVTDLIAETIHARAKNGGPGEGDDIYYLRDAKFAWLMAEGRLQICLLGGVKTSYPAKYLKRDAADPHTTGLPTDVAEQLLGLDPFVAGGSTVALESPRYKEIQSPIEYGDGDRRTGVIQHSFSTTDTYSTTNVTTYVQDYNPAWLGQIFGGRAETLKTILSSTRAAGTTITETQTFQWDLYSVPGERFCVEFWLDQVFGTLALRQQAVAGTPRRVGIAVDANDHPLIEKPVVLLINGKNYHTVTDQDGHYAFYSLAIPEENATIVVGNHPTHPGP